GYQHDQERGAGRDDDRGDQVLQQRRLWGGPHREVVLPVPLHGQEGGVDRTDLCLRLHRPEEHDRVRGDEEHQHEEPGKHPHGHPAGGDLVLRVLAPHGNSSHESISCIGLTTLTYTATIPMTMRNPTTDRALATSSLCWFWMYLKIIVM